jgi:endo-1,4-beta-xylanase
MKSLRVVVSALALAALPSAAGAQNESIIVEAESGVVGGQFSVVTEASVTYATIQSTIGGGNPTTAERVISLTVTFPRAGVYELYGRLRVGTATPFNDDSFFYANGFGAKSPTSDADWILANGLANPVGFTLPGDKVVGGGPATTGVWKWVKLSAFDGGEPPVAGFTVTEGNLTQTFQVAGREDGLGLDKFAFGPQGVFFTVFDLDNGLPGTTEPPPPPYVPPGPPIATGQPKFLGSIYSPSQVVNFTAYFNQVTPENAGKWGSVEGTRDVMNWTQLDTAYALAKNNGFPFRLHTLVWGAQQPPWISALPPAEQRAEIEEWYAELAARYPDTDFIDVVNEPLHNAPDGGGGRANYIGALGGSGSTGWDWVIESFRLARQHFPNAKLGINEFSVTNDTSAALRYIQIVDLLDAEGLIDTVGIQGHAFSTRVPASTTRSNLDLLAATGQPLYITELDIDGPTDEVQLADYQRIFPVFWEHPAVRGITLWGYRPGHWRTAQGAYIVHDNGAERPAMVWLIGYVASAVLPPWIETHPVAQSATVGDDVSFTCAGNGSAPLAYAWLKDGVPIADNPTASTATLTLTFVRTADAGGYACVVSNGGGTATSSAASLTVEKAAAVVTLAGLVQTYDGAPKVVSVTTSPPGLAVAVTYDGSLTPPVAAGNYAVVATVFDADYFGSATGVLTIEKAAATVALSGLVQLYDGTPRAVTVTTTPPGLAVAVTYDGVTTPPTAPGEYQVVATVVDPNYFGSATGTLVVTTTAVVRHAPSLNGTLTGSIQVLAAESVTLNGSARVTGDLLVPGTPTIRLNGHPSYGGTVDGTGDESPSGHIVTLNGNAALRHVVRRTDAVTVPAVPVPPDPEGTRDVVLNSPGQSPGDFATLRNLTLNGNAGAVAVPPGTYGSFTGNGGTAFVLGVAGSSQPAVYNLQGLTLNGGSRLEVAGPVVVNVGSGVTVNGGGGAAGNPRWLRLNIAGGGFTVNGSAAVSAFVVAPAGQAVLNGALTGGLVADRLVINGGGRLTAVVP